MPGTLTTERCGPGGGIPNGSRSPWTTSTGTETASSSERRDFLRPPGRMNREREAEHGAGAGGLGGAAGHARARRAATGDERQAGECVGAQVLDDRQPRRVELVRGRHAAAARHGVRLLDERDDEALSRAPRRSPRRGRVPRCRRPPRGRAPARRVARPQPDARARAPARAAYRSRRESCGPPQHARLPRAQHELLAGASGSCRARARRRASGSRRGDVLAGEVRRARAAPRRRAGA